MSQQQETILYLGRNGAAAAQLQHALELALCGATPLRRPFAANGLASERAPGEDGSAALPFHTLTSQKAALRLVQDTPARLIAVETSDKPASRRRFCESLRQRAPAAPIVAICTQPVAYSFAFDAVLHLPLRSGEVEQVADLLRNRAPEAIIRRGQVTLNTLTRRVVSPMGEYAMTPKQCALLTLLMREANRVVKRADIMRTIWETSYLEDTRTLDVHVRWVRMMIEEDPAQPVLLITKRGVGYVYVAPGEG